MTLDRRTFTAAAAAVAATALSLAATAATAEDRTGLMPVNEVDYYYEIAGTGAPLLLLHGGLGSHDMFDPYIGLILTTRQVIAVDLYGHGRTALTDRPVSLIDMGADMAGLLDALGYGQVDVLGYSMGGGVGLQLALQHPEKVGRLALVSTGFSRDGIHPEILDMQAMVGADIAASMKGTPMYDTYMALAPRQADFPRLLDELGTLMKTDFDWSEQAKALPMPVMLVYGDSDMIRPEHMVEFFHLLGGGLKDGGWMRENVSQNRLAILPGRTHYEIFMAQELYDAVIPFLNDTETAPVWGASK